MKPVVVGLFVLLALGATGIYVTNPATGLSSGNEGYMEYIKLTSVACVSGVFGLVLGILGCILCGPKKGPEIITIIGVVGYVLAALFLTNLTTFTVQVAQNWVFTIQVERLIGIMAITSVYAVCRCSWKGGGH